MRFLLLTTQRLSVLVCVRVCVFVCALLCLCVRASVVFSIVIINRMNVLWN